MALKLLARFVIAIALLTSLADDIRCQTADEIQELFRKASQSEREGRDTDAEALYLRFIRAATGYPPNTISAHMALARLYSKKGFFEHAEWYSQRVMEDILYQKSLEIRLQPRNDTNLQLEPLKNLDNTRQARVSASQSEQQYRHVLENAERSGVEREVSTALNGLAELYRRQGRYADSAKLLRRSLEIDERVYGYDHPHVAGALENLARMLHLQDKFAEAESLYKRSLDIRRSNLVQDQITISTSLNLLANTYQDQGRFGEAEELYKQLLSDVEVKFGATNRLSAIPIAGLARLYDRKGRPWEAERLHKRALAITKNASVDDDYIIANMLHNLAWNYFSVGRNVDAEEAYEQSFKIASSVLGPAHPQLDQMLNRMILFFEKEDAEHWRSLPKTEQLIERDRANASIAYLVLNNAKKDKKIDERRAFERSYRVMQVASSSSTADAVVKLGERFSARSGPLAELLRQMQDVGAEIDELDRELLAAASRSPGDRNLGAEEELRLKLAKRNHDRLRISAEISRRFPTYAALAKPEPLTLAETRKLLRDDEGIVAFDVKPEAAYVWVITKEEFSWRLLPTTDQRLHEQIGKLRKSLTVSNSEPFDTALAYEIYQQTFFPIAKSIAKKTRITIVANGALTSIPFGLLVTRDPTRKSLREIDWFVKSKAFTVVPSVYSVKMMRSLAGLSRAKNEMVAFADPVFSKSAVAKARQDRVALRSLPNLSQLGPQELGDSLPQLPETRKEVSSISKAVGGDPKALKYGLDASETEVKKAALDRYRIVYFATHGLVAGDVARFGYVKAEPALALSMPDVPTALDDGLLQASEVAQLKLDADWVVLSACNTASSDGVGAEALSGLARAFLYAGARSLVVSHWDVDDEATVKLMTRLFEAKKKNPKLSHGEALRESMLQLLSSAQNDSDAHPRLWAPFVVVGEPSK